MARDMTRGPIAKTLVLFSLPLVLSGLLQQLYSWTDALIVGNAIGEGPLAAIGATSSVSNPVIFILSGFALGVSVLVGQSFGAGRHGEIPKIAATFVCVIGLAAMAMGGLGALFSPRILRLLGTPQDIFPMSLGYLRIILIGSPFVAANNIYGAVLRGIGDSRTPLLAIAVSSAANIGLDLLFVVVFGWGVRGAAAATVMAQAGAAVFLIVYTRHRVRLAAFSFGRGMIDRACLAQGLRLGLPAALQQTVRSGGNMLLQSVMNSFGSTVVAAITSAYRVDTLTMLPVINMGAGMSTFAAQNHGAGDLKRARRGLLAASGLAMALAGGITAIIVPLGGPILSLFGIGRPAVAIGWDFLRLCAIFYPLFGLQNALTGYLQGLGDVRFVSVLHTAALAVRIGVSFAMAGAWGHRVIAWAEMISWGFALTLALARYLFLTKRARPN